jgi:Domain of unknown function (DUF5011)
MKKHLLVYLFLIAFGGSILLPSCKKEDKEDPQVSLIGADTIELNSGNYIEYGASAYDNEDGELVPIISNPLNLNSVGTYKITYSAYDKSGNKGGNFRIVIVNQYAKKYFGNYQFQREELDSAGNVIATSNYSQSLATAGNYNKYAIFSKFLNVNFSPSSFKIWAKLDKENNQITILPALSSGSKTGLTFSIAGPEKTFDAHKIDGSGSFASDSLFNFSFTDSIARTIINLTLPPANDTVYTNVVKRYNVVMTRQ